MTSNFFKVLGQVAPGVPSQVGAKFVTFSIFWSQA